MSRQFYFVSPNRQMSILQITGVVLLFIGLVSMLGVGCNTLQNGVPTPVALQLPAGQKAAVGIGPVKPTNEATVMALSVLLITISWPLIFPSMLRSSSKGEVSSTRAAVFMIVAAFIALAVRTGWTDAGMQGLVLNAGWISVLGIAFGAKTLQYWAENNPFARNPWPSTFPQAPGVRTPTIMLPGGPNAAPVSPNPGPVAQGSFQASTTLKAMQLPIHYHNEIATQPPAGLPPAIEKALNSKS
ncbi:hypothetical protein [Puia dinghuensis]|uniref:Uncharacterized protein n=1 Tax=Puia dinghuensis TaxID=1792502 RepID=A0A8J2XWF5_9BACT|nr:hypothetical protein [Puia dinghuensis]GGB23486.1 hypothetical protein GCM10011511_54180 [Puia dinghuensis]